MSLPSKAVRPRYSVRGPGFQSHNPHTREVAFEVQQLEHTSCPSSEIDAFKLAAVAEERHNLSFIPDAWFHAFAALKLWPATPDAHRVLCLVLTHMPLIQHVYNETIDAILRESLFFLRRAFQKLLFDSPGQGTTNVRLRPFVRFLMSMASIGFMVERVDLVVLALEEVLRTDHEDHMFARESLVLCYLKLIGCKRRGQPVYLERTVEQLRALIDCQFPNTMYTLFDKTDDQTSYNEDLMVVRWAEIMISFRDQNVGWIDLVVHEHELCPWIFQYLFDEVPRAPRPSASPSEYAKLNAIRICERLLVCLHDWPDLMIEMHRKLRNDRDINFEMRLIHFAPRPRDELTRSEKHQLGALAAEFLAKGRDTLGVGSHNEAFGLLTVARQSLYKAMKPGVRWYLNGWFQVVSNRARIAQRLGYWNLCRHDTRITLFLRNDHMPSYDRLPTIAKEFKAESLQSDLEKFVAGVKHDPPTNPGQWRAAARTAVALISITAIMASMTGTLTPELLGEMERVGIEDMYTSVSVDAGVLECLSWVGEPDYECA
jgi:hypothetical protein